MDDLAKVTPAGEQKSDPIIPVVDYSDVTFRTDYPTEEELKKRCHVGNRSYTTEEYQKTFNPTPVHTPHHGPTDKVCHPVPSQDDFNTVKISGEVDDGTLRTFATGATRDTGTDKPEHWGFNSALVEKRFGEYMHSKRIQSDGNLRSSDNWKKGIPQFAYFHSLSRHINDMRLIAEGFRDEATEPDMEVVLCAVLFNVQGLLHEVLRENMVHGNPAKK